MAVIAGCEAAWKLFGGVFAVLIPDNLKPVVNKLSHIGFIEVFFADEVDRRDSRSATLRSTKARLNPAMVFEAWKTHDDLRYDRTLLGDLTSLRFLDAQQSAIILGPVGVAKTHLATALGHMAIRRRHIVLFARSDKLFNRL